MNKMYDEGWHDGYYECDKRIMNLIHNITEEVVAYNKGYDDGIYERDLDDNMSLPLYSRDDCVH